LHVRRLSPCVRIRSDYLSHRLNMNAALTASINLQQYAAMVACPSPWPSHPQASVAQRAGLRRRCARNAARRIPSACSGKSAFYIFAARTAAASPRLPNRKSSLVFDDAASVQFGTTCHDQLADVLR
jgi:hypothetical protein